MLAGLILPTDGSATILGCSIRERANGAWRKTGFMLENPAFYPHLSGYDNLRTVSRLFGDIGEQGIEEILAFVEMDVDAHRPYKEYSLGMRRRLDLARVLLHQPEVLILDEPTNGLDPLAIKWTHQLLNKLSKDGTTIFFSSHSLHDVERLCNRIALIHKGHIIVDDTVSNLLQKCSVVNMRFKDSRRAQLGFDSIEMDVLLSVENDEFSVDISQIDVETLLKALAEQDLYPVEVGFQDSLEHLFLKSVGKENDN